MSETAWVIEGDGKYWTGSHADERGFSSDNNDACRFARRQDADKVKFWLLREFAFALRTTEHKWVDGASGDLGRGAVSDLVERLRALAEKATPGEHEARYVPGGMPTTCCDFGVISHATGKETARVWLREDVEFYAACNPQTILALLVRVAELEAIVDDGAIARDTAGFLGTVGDCIRYQDAEITRLRAENERLTGENAALIHDNGNLLASLSGECAARVSVEGERDTATRASAELRIALTDTRKERDRLLAEIDEWVNAADRPTLPCDCALMDAADAVKFRITAALSKTEGKE